MAITTPEEYQQMRAEIMAYEHQQAEARSAQEAATLHQLREFTNSDAYKTVLAALPAIKTAYRDDARFNVFLDNLMIGLPSLAERSGPLPVSLPAPQAPEEGGNEDPVE